MEDGSTPTVHTTREALLTTNLTVKESGFSRMATNLRASTSNIRRQVKKEKSLPLKKEKKVVNPNLSSLSLGDLTPTLLNLHSMLTLSNNEMRLLLFLHT